MYHQNMFAVNQYYVYSQRTGGYLHSRHTALFKVHLICAEAPLGCSKLATYSLCIYILETRPEHTTDNLLCNVMPTMCGSVLLCTPATLLSC